MFNQEKLKGDVINNGLSEGFTVNIWLFTVMVIE